jgi:Ig-like domain from next to BRCA1 gene
MKRHSIPLLIIVGIMVLASCNLPNSSKPTVVGPDALRTIAVKTLDAMSTQLALQPTGNSGGSTTPVPVTLTRPAQTETAPSTTQQVTQTTPVSSCDQAAFIRDATVPDNTLFLPGTAFTKTWEIKNTGSCDWDGTYSLVFGDQGDLMGGQLSIPLVASGSVAAGQSIKVSVDLVAPANSGSYKGYWKLRNPSGNVFFGASTSIWVAIKVIPFDQKFLLVGNLCSAQWRNATVADGPVLACPGKEGDSNGYVLKTDSPKFYNRGDNEPTIIVGPQKVNNGLIVGTFPPILVPGKTEFRTFVGCGEKMDNCNTTVSITAQVGDGEENTLKEWDQKPADFNLVVIDLDAANLTAKNVVFRFYVRANGAADQDEVLFLNPAFVTKP